MDNKLVIMRHGESHGNKARVMHLFEDMNFLTLEGVAHAIGAANILSGREFVQAFASPLTRSKHTLAIVLERLGYCPENVNVTELIREIEFDMSDVRSGNWCPQTETHAEAEARGVKFLHELALPALEKGDILSVSHGLFLMVMVGGIWKAAGETRQFSMDHCVVYELPASWIRAYVREWHKNQATKKRAVQAAMVGQLYPSIIEDEIAAHWRICDQMMSEQFKHHESLKTG